MALTINSWSFDQASYTPGATITLTVDYTTTDTTGGVVTTDGAVTVSLSDGVSPTVTAQAVSPTDPQFPEFVVTNDNGPVTPVPTTITVSDNRSPAGTWTLVSNTLATEAPFTGVAVLTSVA